MNHDHQFTTYAKLVQIQEPEHNNGIRYFVLLFLVWMVHLFIVLIFCKTNGLELYYATQISHSTLYLFDKIFPWDKTKHTPKHKLNVYISFDIFVSYVSVSVCM